MTTIARIPSRDRNLFHYIANSEAVAPILLQVYQEGSNFNIRAGRMSLPIGFEAYHIPSFEEAEAKVAQLLSRWFRNVEIVEVDRKDRVPHGAMYTQQAWTAYCEQNPAGEQTSPA